MYVIRNTFGILVIAGVNVINHAILENIWIIKIAGVGKKLADKLVEECAETVEEVKIAKKMSLKINVVLAYCKLCCFQYSLQSTWNWCLFCLLKIYES